MFKLIVKGKYLRVPVRTGAPKYWLSISGGGGLIAEMECEPAEGGSAFYLDLKGYDGVLEIDGGGADESVLRSLLSFTDSREAPNLYGEAMRPKWHFSAAYGWLNDPNGLYCHEGIYHLFFQHNPYGCTWGNMHWGHAVSADLFNWKQLDPALEPDRFGTMFSGSAVTDRDNTAGCGKDTPILFYTAAGDNSPSSKGKPFTQNRAYFSGGKYIKDAENPILPQLAAGNRDPKVIWNEPTKKWIMVLYLADNDFAFFTSPDTKNWTETQRLTVPGCRECPDFFALAADYSDTARNYDFHSADLKYHFDSNNSADDVKYVFWTAQGKYYVGSFDGEKFTPETELLTFLPEKNAVYAAQTYFEAEENLSRKIQINWFRQTMPNIHFNHYMGVPLELSLTKHGGYRLKAAPSRMIESLYGGLIEYGFVKSGRGHTLYNGASYDAELSFVINPDIPRSDVFMCLNGATLTIDAEKREITTPNGVFPIDVSERGGLFVVRALGDTASVELFFNSGANYVPLGTQRPDGKMWHGIRVGTAGSTALLSARIHELNSILK